MDALKQWLSWDGNYLKVRFMPNGLTNVEPRPEWLVELSTPLGSYKGSHSPSVVEAIAAVNDELSKRDKSKAIGI